MRRLLGILLLLSACGDGGAPAGEASPRIRLWHTFNSTETEALNRVLPDDVETTLLPFARAQMILADALGKERDCPDLVRVDATWLPGLVAADLLAPLPEAAPPRRWLPEAAELTTVDGVAYALPQAIDGLALIYRREAIARAGADWPPRTIGELIAVAHRLTGDGAYGLGLRVDGYWFVPFLRAWGGDVVDPDSGRLGVDSPAAARALERFAEFFGPRGISPPPPASGNESRDEARRFRDGTLAIMLSGPWAIVELTAGDTAGIGVAPFPHDSEGRSTAPRGAQLFVVPRCARNPRGGWQLAGELTAPGLQAEWSRRFGVVPTSAEALANAGELVNQMYQALAAGRPLPRHAVTAELFDDLSPAITAVVAGDATAEEALAGVARGWSRLLRTHAIQPSKRRPSVEPARDAGPGGGASP